MLAMLLACAGCSGVKPQTSSKVINTWCVYSAKFDDETQNKKRFQYILELREIAASELQFCEKANTASEKCELSFKDKNAYGTYYLVSSGTSKGARRYETRSDEIKIFYVDELQSAGFEVPKETSVESCAGLEP